MKRRRLNPVSAKRLAYLQELERMLPELWERSYGMCEVCGDEPAVHAHHKLRRSQGGGNSLDNLLAVCPSCHRMIHDNPAFSYREGYLTRGQTG